jgi:hypothetical protein
MVPVPGAERRGRGRHRPAGRDDELWYEPAPLTVAQFLLFTLVLATPLALGGVHPTTRVVALGIATVAIVWRAMKLEREGLRLRPGAWGLGLGVAALMACIQWLPWPVAIVEAVAPARVALANDLAAALGEAPPSFLSLAFDGSLAALGLAGILLHLHVYLLGRHLRPHPRVRERLVIAIEIAVLLVMAAGVVHAWAGFDKLLGFHEASVPNAGGPFPTTFVNPNHLGALCLLAAIIAFGAAIANKQRMLWHSAMGALASLGVVASMSRANAVLLVVGLLAVGLPWAFARGEAERPIRARRVLIGMFALVFIGIVLMGPERWWSELNTLVDGKTAFANFTGLQEGVWQAGWKAAWTSPWVGLGSANMIVGTPGVVGLSSLGLVSHAHLAPVEVVGELGFVAGGLVLVFVVVGFAAAARRAWGHPLAWAGLVALVLLGIQNLVDFSLWIPGVGVSAAAVAGMVSAFPEGPHAASPTRRRFVLVGGLGALVLGGVVVWQGWSGRPEAWRGEAEAALAAGEAGDWRRLAREHGADFLALEYAGLLAERAGETAAAKRLAQAGLARAPLMASTIGRAFKFAVLDRDDAKALALAETLMMQGPSAAESSWTLVLAARHREPLLEGFLGRESVRVLEGAARIGRAAGPEAAVEVLRWGVARFPDEPLIAEALGSRLGLDPKHREERERLVLRCLGKAGEVADERLRAAWERVGFFFEGENALAGRRFAQAFRLFMGAAELLEGAAIDARRLQADRERRLRALFRAADAAFAAGSLAMADEVVAMLDAETIDHPWNIGHRHVVRSRWLEMKGEWRPAIRELQSAIRHQAQVVSHHRRLADLFDKAGDSEAATRSRLRAKAMEEAPR